MSDTQSPNNKKNPVKLVLVLVAIAVFIGVMIKFGVASRLEEMLQQATVWIESLGAVGGIVFVGVYAIATVAMAPGSVLTAAAGGLFGSFWGVVYTMMGAMLGASLAFLIARYFARDAISKRLAHSEQFTKLDKLTEQHGAVIVAIVRLVPLFPFSLVNYMFGLTKVPFPTYFLYSLLILPGTALYVVGTDAVVTGIREGRVPWLLIGVLLVVAAIVTMLVKQAKKKLQDS